MWGQYFMGKVLTNKDKRRLSEYQSEEPPKVKIIFYSLTRIDGIRKCAMINDPDQEET